MVEIRLSLDDIQKDIDNLSRLAATCDKRAITQIRQVSYWLGRADEAGDDSQRTLDMKKIINYSEEDMLNRCWKEI